MASRKFRKAIFGVGALGISLLGFQNCSEVNFGTATNLSQCLIDPDEDCGHETGNTLRLIQPAVAVRGTACLVCHSQIHANVITDFGYGDPWYFGGGKTVNAPDWYNNYANTWQSSRTIVGSVYVPNKPIPAVVQNSMGLGASPPMNLVQAMTTAYVAQDNWTGCCGFPANTVLEGNSEMAMKIAPPAGQSKVIGRNTIVIRAPAEQEIRDLAPDLFSSGIGAQFIPGASSVNGLIVRQGSVGPYIANDEGVEVQCSKKDIVINGSLLLRRLKIEASNGCRIYVSGSVFVEEGVTYGSGPNQSLQITSANMILMGFNNTSLQRRLFDGRNPDITGLRNYISRANQAKEEAANIGNLKDAETDYGGTRLTVNYSGILLNAPVINSRYFGEVKGAVIAEVAIFALGAFKFAFDPVYTKVDALPLLRKPILGVQ